MKEQEKQPLFHREHSNIKFVAPIIGIIVLLVVILGALMFNTMGLYGVLRQKTIDYASDVSAQLASNIAYRMERREVYIQNLADTFSGMPEFLLTEELLNRKADYLEMDEIFVIKADGTTIPENSGHAGLAKYLADHPELYTDSRIFFTTNEKCFFLHRFSIRQQETVCLLESVPRMCFSRCSKMWTLRTEVCAVL